MKILLFDDRGFVLRGGQRTLVDLALHVQELGHTPVVCTFGEGPLAAAVRDVGLEVSVWPLPDRLNQYDGALRAAGKLERAQVAARTLLLGIQLFRSADVRSADAIYLSALRPALFLWPLIFDRRPSLWYAQGSVHAGLASMAAALAPRHLAVVSSSASVCFGMRRLPARLHRIAIGLQTAEYGENDPGGDCDPIVVLCVAELGPQKGQLRLAEACAYLAQTGAEITLRLVGGSRSRAGSIELAAVEEVVNHTEGLELDDVGWVDDPRFVYQGAHVFCLISEAEGTPRVIVEALASGIPVVSTEVGGIREFVGDSYGVELVDQDASSKDIGCAIEVALALGDAPRLRESAERYSSSAMLDSLARLLTDSGPRSPSMKERLRAYGR